MAKQGWKPGRWRAICDRCGFQFKSDELKLEWDGLRVCSKCWETRHPQELIRVRPEKIVPPWTRPEATDDFVNVCTQCSSSAYADIGTADCMIVGNYPSTAIMNAAGCYSGTLPTDGCYVESFANDLNDWSLITGSPKSNFTVVSTPYGQGVQGAPVTINCVIQKDLGSTYTMKTFEAYVYNTYGPIDDDGMIILFMNPTNTINTFFIVPVREDAFDTYQRLWYGGSGITSAALGPASSASALSLATWYKINVTLADGVNACNITVTNMSTGLTHLTANFTQTAGIRDYRYIKYSLESASGIHPAAVSIWSGLSACDHL